MFQDWRYWRVYGINPRKVNDCSLVEHRLVDNKIQLDALLNTLEHHPIKLQSKKFAFAFFKSGVDPVCEEGKKGKGGRFIYIMENMNLQDILEHWKNLMTFLIDNESNKEFGLCGGKVMCCSANDHTKYSLEVWSQEYFSDSRQRISTRNTLRRTLKIPYSSEIFYEILGLNPCIWEQDLTKELKRERISE